MTGGKAQGEARVAKTVALMRAGDDAGRTARRLAERGFAVVRAPALQMRGLETSPPAGRFDAVLATSAQAFAWIGDDALRPLVALPLFVVGERTRDAALARGFSQCSPAAPAAPELAAAVAGAVSRGARLLYLAGVDRKPDLERDLAAQGLAPTVWEVYEAQTRSAWSEEEARAVAACDAALHFSRRSAECATRLAAAAGVADRWREIVHVAISEDAATPLRNFGVSALRVALSPREDAMIDALVRESGF